MDNNYTNNAGLLVLKFKNNFNRDINVTNITGTEVNLSSLSMPMIIRTGRIGSIDMYYEDSVSVGTKEKLNYVIDFKRSGGTRTHQIRGSATVETQEAGQVRNNLISIFCGDGEVLQLYLEECENDNNGGAGMDLNCTTKYGASKPFCVPGCYCKAANEAW